MATSCPFSRKKAELNVDKRQDRRNRRATFSSPSRATPDPCQGFLGHLQFRRTLRLHWACRRTCIPMRCCRSDNSWADSVQSAADVVYEDQWGQPPGDLKRFCLSSLAYAYPPGRRSRNRHHPYAELKVRIRLPPAKSQRTIGSAERFEARPRARSLASFSYPPGTVGSHR